MTHVFEGVVKGNTIMLEQNVRLPEGTRVQVHVESSPDAGSNHEGQDPFEALFTRSAAYAGRQIGMEEIIGEEKQDREGGSCAWHRVPANG